MLPRRRGLVVLAGVLVTVRHLLTLRAPREGGVEAAAPEEATILRAAP